MEPTDKSIQKITPLGYRLRQNVRVVETHRVYLWLSYPLKYISVSLFWAAAMRRLSKGAFIQLDDILSLSGSQGKEKIEFFLNDLVRKGFLELTGLSEMELLPGISIIIPVYNRPDDIATCLDSLLRLDYPKDKLEIMVVDDASTDETPDVISRYPVNLIRNKKNRRASCARNLAAAKAGGDILAFIDSDCQADSMWLRQLVPAFKEPTIAAVGGIVESYYHTRPLDRYEQVRSSLNMGRWPKRSADNTPFFYVPSCNLLVRRKVFIQIGGFDESLVVGEDVDLCWRIQKQGLHIDYYPAGTVFHKHRNQMAAFCRRRFDYGTSEPLLNRRYPRKVKQMVFAPRAFLFWAGSILSIINGSAWFLLFSVGLALVEVLSRYRIVKQQDLGIPFTTVVISVLRGFAAFFYHCAAFFSRYYLIWFVLLFPILPRLAAILGGMHLITAMVEYGLKKPNLNPARFFFYFTLEQLAYQSGVWWQCLKTLSFKAVNPRIIRSAFQQKQKAE